MIGRSGFLDAVASTLSMVLVRLLLLMLIMIKRFDGYRYQT